MRRLLFSVLLGIALASCGIEDTTGESKAVAPKSLTNKAANGNDLSKKLAEESATFSSLTLQRITMIAVQAYEIALFSDGRLNYRSPVTKTWQRFKLSGKEQVNLLAAVHGNLATLREKNKKKNEGLGLVPRRTSGNQPALMLIVKGGKDGEFVTRGKGKSTPKALKALETLLVDQLKALGLER